MTDPLAIDGGTPVRNELLPYGSQSINEEDAEAVKEVVQDDWITQGSKGDEFDEAVAEYCGAKHGVAFSSGTAALHAAVHALGSEFKGEKTGALIDMTVFSFPPVKHITRERAAWC